MPVSDKESFIAGLQLGRRIKVLDAMRNIEPSGEVCLMTEIEDDILTEDDEGILLE